LFSILEVSRQGFRGKFGWLARKKELQTDQIKFESILMSHVLSSCVCVMTHPKIYSLDLDRAALATTHWMLPDAHPRG